MPLFNDLWDDLRGYLAECGHTYNLLQWSKLTKRHDGWYNIDKEEEECKMYDIYGRPYRTARRTMKLEGPYPSKKKALKAMNELIQDGKMDPDAWLRKRPEAKKVKRSDKEE